MSVFLLSKNVPDLVLAGFRGVCAITGLLATLLVKLLFACDFCLVFVVHGFVRLVLLLPRLARIEQDWCLFGFSLLKLIKRIIIVI